MAGSRKSAGGRGKVPGRRKAPGRRKSDEPRPDLEEFLTEKFAEPAEFTALGNESEPMDLETPVFLVAMPQVLDPFFHMSVVLLIQHESEGSRGFIVNRPTGVSVSTILEGLDILWSGDEEQHAHFGGPVQPQIGTVIYRPDQIELADTDTQHEISPDILLTQNIHDLENLAEAPPSSLRLFLGYAGWGEGQLMQEILRNDWMTAPVDHDLVFAEDPGETWRLALKSVGVDPGQLPTWTPEDAGEVAN